MSSKKWTTIVKNLANLCGYYERGQPVLPAIGVGLQASLLSDPAERAHRLLLFYLRGPDSILGNNAIIEMRKGCHPTSLSLHES